MAVALWGAWGEEWALNEFVSFNGVTKIIRVNDGVTALDIQNDVYSAWVRWSSREPQYSLAMRFTGLDTIPGGTTGATYFTINGWKLVYDPNLVAVSGILYSDDYETAYWSDAGLPVFPATVSAISLSGGGGGTATVDVDEIAAAVAALFAEPSMTTAGIVAQLPTDTSIGDEVETRFLFNDDGRVVSTIEGEKVDTKLRYAMPSEVPGPTSAASIWDAAPDHVKKPLKDVSKDLMASLKSMQAQIEKLAKPSKPSEVYKPDIDISPILEAIQSGDANLSAKVAEVMDEIRGIEMPDSGDQFAAVQEAIRSVEASIEIAREDVSGVADMVQSIPAPDLSQVATKEEIAALMSVAEKLRNYDDSDLSETLESLMSQVRGDTGRLDQKLDIVLDNQLTNL